MHLYHQCIVSATHYKSINVTRAAACAAADGNGRLRIKGPPVLTIREMFLAPAALTCTMQNVPFDVFA